MRTFSIVLFNHQDALNVLRRERKKKRSKVCLRTMICLERKKRGEEKGGPRNEKRGTEKTQRITEKERKQQIYTAVKIYL